MQKTIHICDKCKCEEITESTSLPEGWVDIKFKVNHEYYGDHHLCICNVCAEKANLLKENGNAKSAIVPGVAEQLLDLLTEIAQEAVQNA